MISRPNLHNPFLSRVDQDEHAIQVTSWVSRTGGQAGSLLVRTGNASHGASVGPGGAVLIDYQVPGVRLVGSA